MVEATRVEGRAEHDREYDLIVFGASGYTGGKVAEYLARHAPSDFRWAIAGRNVSKLETVKARLGRLDARCLAVGIVSASVEDPESLARMAGSTRVLLTTVGPFADYGEPVVGACVASRTHYVDSTGEAAFVSAIIDQYDARAIGAGIRVVPSCGFDAAVADLGAYFAIQRIPSDCPIRLFGFVRMRASFSGGTERSALKALATLRDAGRGAGSIETRDGRRVREIPAAIRRRPALGGWTAPFPTIDASVILRSAASSERYGPDFGYAHHTVHPSFLVLMLASLVFGVVAFLVRFAPLRALFLGLAKKPGQGPTDEQLARGWFSVRFIAEHRAGTSRTEVSGGEPAYVETSKILGEAALCLALDESELPQRAGVLTPVEAMGDALLARVERAGIRFTLW
jgi:saccharopine dehydrogenase (NAD+, L-glutamate forming)